MQLCPRCNFKKVAEVTIVNDDNVVIEVRSECQNCGNVVSKTNYEDAE